MITVHEFRERWKGSDLSKLSENSIAKKYLSEADAGFLITAGLPVETFFDAEFSFDLSEDSLKFLDENMNEVSEEDKSKKYLQIGKQLSSLICLDLESHKIIILRTKIKKKEFVCSSINQLAELIVIFDESYDRFREGKINRKNKKEIKSEAANLTDLTKQVDPEVFLSETVWVEMIEIVNGM